MYFQSFVCIAEGRGELLRHILSVDSRCASNSYVISWLGPPLQGERETRKENKEGWKSNETPAVH